MARRVKVKTKRTVEYRPVDARRLLTIDRDDEVWEDESTPKFKRKKYRAAIVRVRPPGHASDSKIEAVRAELVRCKAGAIKVLPREAGDMVVDVEGVAIDPDDTRSLRQVVMDRAKRVKNVRNQDELEGALVESLDAAGL